MKLTLSLISILGVLQFQLSNIFTFNTIWAGSCDINPFQFVLKSYFVKVIFLGDTMKNNQNSRILYGTCYTTTSCIKEEKRHKKGCKTERVLFIYHCTGSPWELTPVRTIWSGTKQLGKCHHTLIYFILTKTAIWIQPLARPFDEIDWKWEIFD